MFRDSSGTRTLGLAWQQALDQTQPRPAHPLVKTGSSGCSTGPPSSKASSPAQGSTSYPSVTPALGYVLVAGYDLAWRCSRHVTLA
jgi:hypothetical protein